MNVYVGLGVLSQAPNSLGRCWPVLAIFVLILAVLAALSGNHPDRPT
jgi:hypothetical protein